MQICLFLSVSGEKRKRRRKVPLLSSNAEGAIGKKERGGDQYRRGKGGGSSSIKVVKRGVTKPMPIRENRRGRDEKGTHLTSCQKKEKKKWRGNPPNRNHHLPKG